jgi:TrkA-C domain
VPSDGAALVEDIGDARHNARPDSQDRTGIFANWSPPWAPFSAAERRRPLFEAGARRPGPPEMEHYGAPPVSSGMPLLSTGQPDLRLEELVIAPDSPLVGRTLQELTGPTVPLLPRRQGGQLLANPTQQLRLQPGDTLVACGEASALPPLN